MKYGTRNIPERTLATRTLKVFPSNGREPQTNTYNTTPKLCKQIILPVKMKHKQLKHFSLNNF